MATGPETLKSEKVKHETRGGDKRNVRAQRSYGDITRLSITTFSPIYHLFFLQI